MPRLAATVTLLFLALAAPAGAASTVVHQPEGLAITGSAGRDVLTVAPQPDGQIKITDPAGVTSDGSCSAVEPGSIVCPAAGLLFVRAEMLGGDDALRAEESAEPLRQRLDINGGEGADVLEGGSERDLLWGAPGDDVLVGGGERDQLFGHLGDDRLDGGAGPDDLDDIGGNNVLTGGTGDDVLTSGDGDDVMSGGDGNDALSVGGGADVIEGDDGIDVVTYGGVDLPVTITLGNGEADDGMAGDGALVGTTVENALGGDADDVIVGSAGDNVLDGGFGNDEIIGGAGSDTVDGWAGDDRIDLRDDGTADTAKCGAGDDTVRVDDADIVAADCEEQSHRAPDPEPPAADDGHGKGSGPPVPDAPRAKPRVTLRIGTSRASRRYALRGRLRLPRGVSARIACAGRPLVTVSVRQGKRTVARARARLRRDCTFSTTLRLPATTRTRSAKLRFTARFPGNAYLAPRAGSARSH